MKLKHFLTLASLVIGGGSLWADDVFKDVTSTYLTNANFEGEYSVYSNPKSDRAIYQPNGWTVEYTNGKEWDMTILKSGDLASNSFSSMPSLTSGGNQTYKVRFNNSYKDQKLGLYQTVTLPLGSYKVTIDYYKGGSGGDAYLVVNSVTQNSSTNGSWTTVNISFDSDGSSSTKIGCRADHTNTYEKFYAFDNFKLEWNLTQSLASLITSATAAYEAGGSSDSALKAAIDDATAKKESTDADELEGAYNALKTAAELTLNRRAWSSAKSAAETALEDNTYSAVTGEEKTALQTEINKAEPTTAQGYDEAKLALEKATSTFTAAKSNYEALEAAKSATTPELSYAATSKKTALTNAKSVTATSAADADDKTAAITTALRAYYESHALAEGVEGAVNMTSSIANPDAMDANNGWTWTGTKNDPKNGEPWTDASGSASHWYFDGGNWNGSNWTTTMAQTISLPAGKFLLTAKGRAMTSTTLTMAVGEQSVALPNVGNTGNVFDRGWGDASVEFVTDGSDITITVTATAAPTHEWFSISDFRLMRLELYTEMAKEADYQAMDAALETAKSKTLGFDVNEYAPYNNVAAIQAIAAAEAIDKNVENAKADIEAITAALGNWTANTTEVDAIYDGTLANAPIQATSENVVLPGWVTKSGNTRQTFSGTGEGGKACLADAEDQVGLFVHPGTYNYGETAGYTMPLKAGVIYQAEAKYCAWQENSNQNFTLTILKDNSTIATQSFGKVEATVDAEHALKAVKLYFEVEEDGNYVLSVIPSGNTFVTDFHLKKAVAEDVALSEDVAYTPVKTYANVTMTRTIKAAYNTVVLPFALTADQVTAAFGENSKVYTFSEKSANANSVELNFTEGDGSISANVPVLVKATTASSAQTFNGVMIEAPASAVQVAGEYVDYVGVYATTNLAAGDFFLATQNEEQKIFQSEGNNDTVKPFRAYFQKKVAGNVKAALFIDGVATAIDGINADVNNDAEIFNLAGQRVNKAQKGIYIINGKKVLVK